MSEDNVAAQQTVWVDLLGCQVRYFGNNWRLRGIEAGQEHDQGLILLHGIGGHAEAFSRNIQRLAERYHVYALDLPYHGYSQKEPFDGENIVDVYVEALFDFVEAEGLTQPHVEGESLGAVVALHAMLKRPDTLGGVVLNTGAPILWSENFRPHIVETQSRTVLATSSMEAIDRPSRESVRRRLEWLMARPERVTNELVEIRYAMYSNPKIQTSIRNVFKNAFVDRILFDKYWISEERLQNVQNKTLVFWTEFNPGEGPEVGQRLHELIPRSSYYCMDDAGHWPQWEHPAEHDEVVLDFLGKM